MCWLIISNNGRHAFVANPIADTLTRYTIQDDGSLVLLNARAEDVTGGDPRDMALSAS